MPKQTHAETVVATSVTGNTPKPGWQTTEFWGHLLTQVIALLSLVGEFNTSSPVGNALIKLAAVLGSATSSAGYAVGRGKAKALGG